MRAAEEKATWCIDYFVLACDDPGQHPPRASERECAGERSGVVRTQRRPEDAAPSPASLLLRGMAPDVSCIPPAASSCSATPSTPSAAGRASLCPMSGCRRSSRRPRELTGAVRSCCGRRATASGTGSGTDACAAAGLDLARRRDSSRARDARARARPPHRHRARSGCRIFPTPSRSRRSGRSSRPQTSSAYDRGGVGDAVGELLPAGAIPILIVAGEGASKHGSCWHIGKTKLVGDLLHLSRAGRLIVPAECPGAEQLRAEMQNFIAIPTRRGFKLQARSGEFDDITIAAALAIVAARVGSLKTAAM